MKRSVACALAQLPNRHIDPAALSDRRAEPWFGSDENMLYAPTAYREDRTSCDPVPDYGL